MGRRLASLKERGFIEIKKMQKSRGRYGTHRHDITLKGLAYACNLGITEAVSMFLDRMADKGAKTKRRRRSIDELCLALIRPPPGLDYALNMALSKARDQAFSEALRETNLEKFDSFRFYNSFVSKLSNLVLNLPKGIPPEVRTHKERREELEKYLDMIYRVIEEKTKEDDRVLKEILKIKEELKEYSQFIRPGKC